VLSFPLLFLVAIVAGFVGAMAGMGGGVVLIPVLTTFFHVDIKHAIAVSMLSVIATSSGAASAYVKDRLTNLKVGMFLETFTMMGALAGAALAVHMNPRWLYLSFGVVLLASWSALWFGQQGTWRPVAHPDALSRWLELSGEYRETEEGPAVSYHATRAGLGAVCMVGAGAVAGLLGIGAGALKVLVHDLIMGLPAKVSTTTSNLIIGVTALAGSSVYLAQGLIDPALAAPIVLGILLGAWGGTRVLVRLNNRKVRGFFLFVLAILGVEMLIRGIHYG
jgi:uncharacterized protein